MSFRRGTCKDDSRYSYPIKNDKINSVYPSGIYDYKDLQLYRFSGGT